MILSYEKFNCFWSLSEASVILSSGDVFRVFWTKESCAFVFPVGIFMKIVNDWIVNGWQTAFYVSTFDVERRVFELIVDWLELEGHEGIFPVFVSFPVWIHWIASAHWMSFLTLITWSCFTSFSTSAWSLICLVFFVKFHRNLLFAISLSSTSWLSKIFVSVASNSSDWSNFALDVASSSCYLAFLFSSSESEVTSSEIYKLDLARSALASAFARDLFAHRTETFHKLGSIRKF